jgi:hypothetical protein
MSFDYTVPLQHIERAIARQRATSPELQPADYDAMRARLVRIRAKHQRTGGPDEQELADMGRTS